MQQSIKIYQINKDIFRFEDEPSDEGKINHIIEYIYIKYRVKKNST